MAPPSRTATPLIARVEHEQSAACSRSTVIVSDPSQPAWRGMRIVYDVEGDRVPSPAPRADFAVLALLFHAMRANRDLYVDGEVSSSLLANLVEFQSAWRAWKPKSFTPISIHARAEVDDAPSAGRRAVVAVSGGLDSSYTVLRHATANAGRQTLELVTAMLVHGFEFPLNKPEPFVRAAASVRSMLATLGVPLTIVRTNWRTEASGNWDWEHGAGLAACLTLFSAIADVGLVAADDDYGSFVVPWGLNLVTNRFMSSSAFRIVTDGGGMTRTAKAAVLAQHPEIANQLRVCWEGSSTGGNCGSCEKCVRTKLNFLAVGAPVPTSLGGPPRWWEWRALKARDRTGLTYYQDIASFAARADAPLVAMWKLRLLVLVNQVCFPWRQWYDRATWRLVRALKR